MFRLVPLLVLFGFAGEIASIIWVGTTIGVLGTLVWMVLDVFAGAALLRSTGTDMASALRGRVNEPGTDRRFAARMILRAMAGLFLIVPGFFSDGLAAILMLGPVQSWLASKVQLVATGSASGLRRPAEDRVTVIEATAVEVPSDSDQNPRK
jgi:UPF0716 protein FxsA